MNKFEERTEQLILLIAIFTLFYWTGRIVAFLVYGYGG